MASGVGGLISREDVFIETEATDGFAAESGNGITVGLSLDITQDLLMEGLVRDIVRLVQSMRKNADFAVEDRIEISWDFDGQIAVALGKFEKYFMSETLTNNIKESIHSFDYEEVVEINEKRYKIKLKRDSFKKNNLSNLVVSFDKTIKNLPKLSINLIHEKLNDNDVAGITSMIRKIKVPISPNIEERVTKTEFPITPPKLFDK